MLGVLSEVISLELEVMFFQPFSIILNPYGSTIEITGLSKKGFEWVLGNVSVDLFSSCKL